MSALKFECPGCGQHMECERALSGDIIHCPRCCAELRIPFGDISGLVSRAELIRPAPPAQTASAAAAIPHAEVKPEIHELICPVCESQLRIRSAAPKRDGDLALAELIKKGEPKQAKQPFEPVVEPKPEETHPDVKHMSLEERERHIAAARDAHPIQLSKPVKPRLSYVLSGKSPMEEKQESKVDEAHPPFNE